MKKPLAVAKIDAEMSLIPVRAHILCHGLRRSGEEIDFTARPKIQSQSKIFSYGRIIFCLPHQPDCSVIFDLCLHWVSVVRVFCAQ